eukprot:766577-Hanusia_phi.AAC.5
MANIKFADMPVLPCPPGVVLELCPIVLRIETQVVLKGPDDPQEQTSGSHSLKASQQGQPTDRHSVFLQLQPGNPLEQPASGPGARTLSCWHKDKAEEEEADALGDTAAKGTAIRVEGRIQDAREDEIQREDAERKRNS